MKKLVFGLFIQKKEIPKDKGATYFIEFTGSNHGAIPIHDENGLNFNVEYGKFFACSHEIKVALKYDLIKIDEIHSVYEAMDTIRFREFVDTFYSEKVAAKKSGDKLSEMFSKFMLNSAYGKFGQNPLNFNDFMIVRDFGEDQELIQNGYSIKSEFDDFELWARPTEIKDHSFFDVSIGASITSAARSILLEALQLAENVIYCDTDSITCKSLNSEVSSTILGAWKYEGEFDNAAIAGKKLYALYNDKNDKHKIASKGGTLEVKDIINICKGKYFINENRAPTFSLNKKPHFISRKFKMTVDNK